MTPKRIRSPGMVHHGSRLNTFERGELRTAGIRAAKAIAPCFNDHAIAIAAAVAAGERGHLATIDIEAIRQSLAMLEGLLAGKPLSRPRG